MVNCERRLQRVARALTPRRGTRPDGEIFQLVARAMGAAWSYRTSEDVFREIARLAPGYHGLSWASLLPDGLAWSAGSSLVAGSLTPAAEPAGRSGEGHWLLAGGTLFLQGGLSHRGTTLPGLAGRPRAFLAHAEAQRLGLAEGDAVRLSGPGGALVLPVALDDSVPPGSIFVPYAQRGVELNRLGAPTGAGLRVRLEKSRESVPMEA
jgi:predicted molibdopterin-dependent oxidoreductase YjgC